MTAQHSDQKPVKPASKHEQGRLERLAQQIDPPGREIPENDLKDPGKMTPEAPPVDNRS